MMRRNHLLSGLRPTMVGAALLVGGFAVSAPPLAAQIGISGGANFTTTWVPDERADPGPTIGAGFAISHNAERPVELVLVAHRLRDGRVVDTHRSGSFTVGPDRPFRLDSRLLPTRGFYEGRAIGETVTAPSPVPVASGERDANTWWQGVQERADITDWEAARDVEQWKQRDALVLVVTPADARLRSEAMAYPLLVRLEARSR